MKGDKYSSPRGFAGKVFRFGALIKAALSQESFVKSVDFLLCLFRPVYQVIEQDKKKNRMNLCHDAVNKLELICVLRKWSVFLCFGDSVLHLID